MGAIGYEGLMFFGMILFLFIVSFVLAYHNDRYSESDYAPKKETGGKRQTVSLEQFVPCGLFEILGVGDVQTLSVEELKVQKELTAGMLYMDVDGYSATMEKMPPQEAYRYINGAQERCIPRISDAGGIITDFNGSGISALFSKEPGRGLQAAIEMCEAMSEEADRYPAFAVSLCYGGAMVGVTGDVRRLMLMVLSNYTGLGTFLQRMASRYYTRIIVTGSYAQQIPDFERKYNNRLIGCLYIQSTDNMEKLYDVFDGDTPEVRNQKRKTKTLFERGVSFFLSRRFQEARACFIEVLKMDRYDRAAREYVLRCDQSIDVDEADIYLEKY